MATIGYNISEMQSKSSGQATFISIGIDAMATVKSPSLMIFKSFSNTSTVVRAESEKLITCL